MNSVEILTLFCMCYVASCKEIYLRCENGQNVSLKQLCGNDSCMPLELSDKFKSLCQNINEPIKTCPPLNTATVTLKCVSPKKKYIPCNKPLPTGSIAYFNCKPYYLPTKSVQSYNKLKCLANGEWDKDIRHCKPDCGKSSMEVVPLILKGWVVREMAWPWHASLYSLDNGTWEFSCGGSLISDQVVLTAAHCIWQIIDQPENLKIALGKYSTNFSLRNEYTQILNVNKIIQQPLYNDYIGNYGSDIALIVLQHSVKFSSFVLPVCIQWNLHDITEDMDKPKIGTVLGMGFTENDTVSQELRASSMSVVKNEDCVNHHLVEFRKYITHTTFCAGWINGSGVCNGDSGGGLVFQNPSRENRWVLEGVVSIGPKRPNSFLCNPAYYSLFTKVGMYVNWIKNTLVKIHGYNFISEDEIF